MNIPIAYGDVAVFPGDVVVGDKDGVVVIPAHLTDEIATKAVEMTVFEDFVIDQVQKGASILGLYPPPIPARKTHLPHGASNTDVNASRTIT